MMLSQCVQLDRNDITDIKEMTKNKKDILEGVDLTYYYQ